MSVLIMQENMLFSGEIYTTGKNFILPRAGSAFGDKSHLWQKNWKWKYFL